jgi:hypothetical protein
MPIHVRERHVVLPSHEMQYVPRHICRLETDVTLSIRAIRASCVGMASIISTMLLVEGSGCWARMICVAAPATGVWLTCAAICVPPWQIVPAVHSTQDGVWPTTRKVNPGLHVH